jgi:dihydroorotase
LIVDTILYNTKIYFQGNLIDAGIAINEGKIVKIAKKTNLPQATKKVNLKGYITLPGLIDPHVHLRDQKLSYKEDFLSGTSAAAAGGVTSILDMPNNNPVTNDVVSLKKRIELAKKDIKVNVGFFSALPTKIEQISEIIKAGAIGFKIYFSKQIGGIDIDDDQKLIETFKEIAQNKVPIAVHAEDPKILEETKKAMQKSGKNDIKAYLKVHSPKAEKESIKRIITLMKNTGVHVHFCHISSAQGLNVIVKCKKSGLNVSCEVTPHNLFLTSKQYNDFGNFGLTDPPLRSKNDIHALWNGIKLGQIRVIASDHAPHSLEEKNYPNIWDVKPGIPGLETTILLLLKKVNEGNLTISELVRLTAEEPAKLFNLKKRGFIEKGNNADLIIVNIKEKFKIDPSIFYSKAKYSPFNKISGIGKPMKTFVNGRLVMEDGTIFSNSFFGSIL